jgi:hypothetical protein
MESLGIKKVEPCAGPKLIVDDQNISRPRLALKELGLNLNIDRLHPQEKYIASCVNLITSTTVWRVTRLMCLSSLQRSRRGVLWLFDPLNHCAINSSSNDLISYYNHVKYRAGNHFPCYMQYKAILAEQGLLLNTSYDPLFLV